MSGVLADLIRTAARLRIRMMMLRRRSVLVVSLLVLAVGGPLLAAPQARVPRDSLANLLPSSTGVFVELQRLQQSDERLRQANLWRAASLLLGNQLKDRTTSLDWRGVVRRYLGLTSESAIDEIFGQRVALAARSWKELADAVVVTRLRSPKALEQVIGPKRVVETEQHGQVGVYRTVNGLWIASNGRFAAFTRGGRANPFFRGVVELLGKPDGAALGRQARFVDHVGRLGRGYSGCLYLASFEGQEESIASVLPAIRSAAIGVYLRDDRVNFEVRATLQKPAAVSSPEPIDLKRLEMLPDSTLLAWTTSIDLPAAYQTWTAGDPSETAQRYLGGFKDVLDLDALERDVIQRVGPRMIVVWDRLRAGGDTPQLAVLFESQEPRRAAETLAEAFGGLTTAVRPTQDDGDSGVDRSNHLEVEILSVSLQDLVPSGIKGSPAAMLLASMEPSFAAVNGWMIAATSPAQIRQIIDAQEGWIPTLGSLEELRIDRWRMGEGAAALAIAQPAMASAVVASWQAPGEPGQASPWTEMLGSQPRQVRQVRGQSLGIGIRKDPASGEVKVVRVHPQQPAAGKLEIGDRIIGVDGHLLSLQDPSADLRRRILESPDPTRLTLRVRREGAVLDVEVPLAPRPKPPGDPTRDPVEALRQLREIGRTVSYAAYAVLPSPPDQYHAMLSIRLVPQN